MKMKAEILVHFDANSYREIVNFEDEMGSLIRLIGEQYACCLVYLSTNHLPSCNMISH